MSNPSNSAMPYMQEIPGTITPYYNPYINAGNQALSTLMQQFQTLLTNPQAIMQMAGSGYQQSPGYQYDYNQGMNAANSAAASGGMLGTPYEQQNAAAMSENLANQDYEQYLNQALGLYSQGLQGEEGINQMGYQASDALASGLATNLTNEAGLSYAGTEADNMANQSMWNSIIGGTAALGSAAIKPKTSNPSADAGGSGAGMSTPQMGGYGDNGYGMQGPGGSNNGMLGPGGTQQNFSQILGQMIAKLLHGGGNNSGAMMGGYY